MSGSHNHAAPSHGRAFAVGISLNLGFVAVEAACGVISGSLALLADAGHNLSDVLGLVLAWGASPAVPPPGMPLGSSCCSRPWRCSTTAETPLESPNHRSGCLPPVWNAHDSPVLISGLRSATGAPPPSAGGVCPLEDDAGAARTLPPAEPRDPGRPHWGRAGQLR
ncbi:cation transporter [Myxococcaceae bacterium GXIMD 01537]